MKWILALTSLMFFSCSTPEVQDAYTDDNNYFDYQYYSDDLSEMDNFDQPPYDDYFYYEPVYQFEDPEEDPEGEDSDDWFFEDY